MRMKVFEFILCAMLVAESVSAQVSINHSEELSGMDYPVQSLKSALRQKDIQDSGFSVKLQLVKDDEIGPSKWDSIRVLFLTAS